MSLLMGLHLGSGREWHHTGWTGPFIDIFCDYKGEEKGHIKLLYGLDSTEEITQL